MRDLKVYGEADWSDAIVDPLQLKTLKIFIGAFIGYSCIVTTAKINS